jgi:Domain of unknown function (DUF4604)
MRFKAKDLKFEADEPAFLRRLRGQVTGNDPDRDPDRHIMPVALPKKPKQEDQDDAPTYVLEGSDATISKEEYATLTGSKSSDQPDEKDVMVKSKQESAESNTDAPRTKQKLTDVGIVSKKRKAIKVVGDDVKDEPSVDRSSTAKKPKKKANAIKLSFGEDDEK